MGESAAETVKEIEETRGRLESNLRELEDRLPAPAVLTKRLAGLAAGGGVGGTLFWFVVKRARKRSRKKKAKVEDTQVHAVVNVVPETWAEKVSTALDDGRWKPYAAVAGGTWLVFRLLELRQLGKVRRALVTRA